MLQFFSNFEKQQAAGSRRKSRFVSEFRSQLVRIPLHHRASDPKKPESFVLNDSACNPRLRVANSMRQKRKVSDWAKKKNLSYQKARDDMLLKNAHTIGEEKVDALNQTVNRRLSRSFIDCAKEQNPYETMNKPLPSKKPKSHFFSAWHSPLVHTVQLPNKKSKGNQEASVSESKEDICAAVHPIQAPVN